MTVDQASIMEEQLRPLSARVKALSAPLTLPSNGAGSDRAKSPSLLLFFDPTPKFLTTGDSSDGPSPARHQRRRRHRSVSSPTVLVVVDPSRSAYPEPDGRSRRRLPGRTRQITPHRLLLERAGFLSPSAESGNCTSVADANAIWDGQRIETDIVDSNYEQDLQRMHGQGQCANSGECGEEGRKRVSFGTIEIREYLITLGDHPMCSGPPLTLSWEYWPETISGTTGSNELRTIEEYEKRKGLKLRGNQLRLNPWGREKLLLEAGVTEEEIAAAAAARREFISAGAPDGRIGRVGRRARSLSARLLRRIRSK